MSIFVRVCVHGCDKRVPPISSEIAWARYVILLKTNCIRASKKRMSKEKNDVKETDNMRTNVSETRRAV